MNLFQERQQQLIQQIALQACAKPLLPSGLWFHGDIRDNFYYASYLFTAANREYTLPIDKKAAADMAEAVFLKVLSLQDRNPDSDTYGHWPLNLGDNPDGAPINRLPVELMGCLMAQLYQTNQSGCSERLREALYEAIVHMYKSRYYIGGLRQYNHHEAKHTAAAILFGILMKDDELLQAGHKRVQSTAQQLQSFGMSEYGILPWFWHWVQALSAAWELAEDEELKGDIKRLLDWLWEERTAYYFKGAWVGPHSRSLSIDAPSDRCVAIDYVQFGDIDLPADLPRVEYAGLLSYEISEQQRRKALDRPYPMELRRQYPSSAEESADRLHSYVYMTQHYALGGMWERRKEFDNEQRRWDITFPMRESSVNQLYFFHPAGPYKAADPRHSSEAEQAAFHQNIVFALYQSSADDNGIVGVLPPGQWTQDETALYGRVDDVYLAVYLMKPFRMEQKNDRCTVESVEGGLNGVVIEAASVQEEAEESISSLADFMKSASCRKPVFSATPFSVSYSSRRGDKMHMQWEDKLERLTINGSTTDFRLYR